MTDQVISKLVNQVSFKIDNKSWKDAQNKIKRLAGMWHKSSQGFSKAMEQGRRPLLCKLRRLIDRHGQN